MQLSVKAIQQLSSVSAANPSLTLQLSVKLIELGAAAAVLAAMRAHSGCVGLGLSQANSTCCSTNRV